MHVLRPDGVIVSEGAALAAAGGELAGLGWLPRAAERPAVLRLLDRAYRWVAGHRAVLAHAVPDRPVTRRLPPA